MPIGGRGLTQIANNCFIHTIDVGGQPSARYVVGRIFRQPTGGRGNPPDCLSGYPTDYTPFALGHVMALELGGPDDSANIVPQYGVWQGNVIGAWRQMETHISNDASEVYLAEVTYPAAATVFLETNQDQRTRFGNGDKLFHWTHAQLPTRFRVWTVAMTWTSGGADIAAYFTANDAGKDATVAALFAALPATALRLDASIDAMPDVDRAYWRAQMVNDFARQAHRRYQTRVDMGNRQHQRLYEVRLKAWQVANNVGKRSPRTSIKVRPLGQPLPPRDEVSLDLARWLQVNANLAAVHTDFNAHATAHVGWTAPELALFTPQSIAGAVFG
jgi:hypothetical protein